MLKLSHKGNPDSASAMMIDMLGVETTDRIRKALGGQEIKLPEAKRLHSNHRIVRALGWEDARTLCKNFEHEFIYFPYAEKTGNEKLDGQIAALRSGVNKGLTTNDLAVLLGVSARWVRKLITLHGIARPKQSPRRPRPQSLTLEAVPTSLPSNSSLQRGKTYAFRVAMQVPDNSNGALTGLAPISGTFSPPANENRASGL